jgi:hypothetical protein
MEMKVFVLHFRKNLFALSREIACQNIQKCSQKLTCADFPPVYYEETKLGSNL